jgi:hypothetical protein
MFGQVGLRVSGAVTDGTTWAHLAFGSADNAPPTDCGTHSDCVRLDQAWLVPGGVIVAGTTLTGAGGRRLWVATPGS